MEMKLNISKRLAIVLIALVLFFGGFGLAKGVTTAGGTVDVERVDFLTVDGYKMSAKIYIPETATVETPAPGIIMFPGGNANLENLSALNIELSRRGYVTMTVDPYTIGRSDVVGSDVAPDVGSRAAMDYFMSLKVVDSDCVGVAGHSAGSGRGQWAATTDPDKKVIREGVKAVMNIAAGSFSLEGVNMGVFIGTWDNTYGSGKLPPSEAVTHDTFTQQLGANPVEIGKPYTMADGSVRTFYQSSSGHPTALLLPGPIGDVCQFFNDNLAPAPTPKDNMTYGWKELGTSLGIIACFMMMFPVISLLLDQKFFATVIRPMPAPVSGVNKPFIFYLVMPAVINTLICKWAIFNGQQILSKVNFILRINNTNGFVFWFGCSALLSVLILAIRFKWDGTIDKVRITTHAKTTWPNFFKSLLIGFMAVGTVYLMTYAAEVLFGLSPRIWKVQINVLNDTRLGLFATYFPLYLLFFGVFNFSQTIGLKIQGQSEASFTRLVLITSAIPAGMFLLYAYGKLWLTGITAITNVQMSRANSTLLNCILTYFISCKVTTYCYKKTGGFHTGAVINAIIMTWTAVATDLITAL